MGLGWWVPAAYQILACWCASVMAIKQQSARPTILGGCVVLLFGPLDQDHWLLNTLCKPCPSPPTAPQVSVQYNGGRGAPSGPAWGGKEGVMDLLITENVFYGREAQVGGWTGGAGGRVGGRAQAGGQVGGAGGWVPTSLVLHLFCSSGRMHVEGGTPSSQQPTAEQLPHLPTCLLLLLPGVAHL